MCVCILKYLHLLQTIKDLTHEQTEMDSQPAWGIRPVPITHPHHPPAHPFIRAICDATVVVKKVLKIQQY